MERMHEIQNQDQTTLPERSEIARRLRLRGIDVDYEDWDGLSDERVVDIVWNKVFIHGGIDFEEIITDVELNSVMEHPHEV